MRISATDVNVSTLSSEATLVHVFCDLYCYVIASCGLWSRFDSIFFVPISFRTYLVSYLSRFIPISFHTYLVSHSQLRLFLELLAFTAAAVFVLHFSFRETGAGLVIGGSCAWSWVFVDSFAD